MIHNLKNTKADRLASLNGRGVYLMHQWISRILDEKRKLQGANKKIIRILDIGCGHSPYLQGIDLADIDLHLWDTVDLLDPNLGLEYEPLQPEKFKHRHFPVNKGLDGAITLDSNEKPFDIIILSAVLHELYQQWNLKKLTKDLEATSEIEFAGWFFKQFCTLDLVDNNSIVIVGEIYHRNIWPRELLEKARKVQHDLCEHADPPTAFPEPTSMVHGAREQGFALEYFDECFSVPEDHEIYILIDQLIADNKLDDKDVKLIFRNRRFATLVYSRSGKDVRNEDIKSSGDLIREAMKVEGALGEELENLNKALLKWRGDDDVDLRKDYDQVFVWGSVEKSDLAIFPSLANECAKLTCEYFQYMKMAPPVNQAFWFSIYSLCLKLPRYLPYCAKNKEYLTIFTNPCNLINEAAKPAPDKWSAIAYNYLLGNKLGKFDEMNLGIQQLNNLRPPSLFDWLIQHKSPPRSITITYAQRSYELRDVDSVFMEDAMAVSTLDVWREGSSSNIENKHIVGFIPYHDANETMNLGKEVNCLTDYQYCGEESKEGVIALVRESIASVYLDFIFLSRFIYTTLPVEYDYHIDNDLKQRQIINKTLEALECFTNRWLNKKHFFDSEATLNDLYSGNASIILPIPFKTRIRELIARATKEISKDPNKGMVLPRSWITFSPSSLLSGNQDGNAPGNVMLFTDRIYGAMLLDLIMIQMEKTFQAIRATEFARKTKLSAGDEARGQAFETMLTSFGHDGKRPARTIEMALRNTEIPDESVRALALYTAHSLVNRLESYSRIPSGRYDDDNLVRQLEGEVTRAYDLNSWVTIERLWQVEALNQVIRIFVDSLEWKRIREEGLFSSGFKWKIAEQLIAPLIALERDNKNVLSESHEVEQSILECITNLAACKPSVQIKYEGPILICPQELPGGKGLPTIPKLRTILAFVFSELMTNMAKRGWKNNPSGIRNNGLLYALRAREESDGYYFDVGFAPSAPNSPPNPMLTGEDRTVTGITSVKLALQSIASQASEKVIIWNKPNGAEESFGSQPFPNHWEGTLCGVDTLWTLSTIGPISSKAFRRD